MKKIYKTVLGCMMTILSTSSLIAQNFVFNNTSTAIPDAGAPVTSTILVKDVGILNASEGKTPRVFLNIVHNYTADLDITLTSPEGTTIILSDDNGGSGDNYTATAFSHTASTSITNGSAPFTGAYLPEESFSNFDGENADGIWTLSITDDDSGASGTFVSCGTHFRYVMFFSHSLDNSNLNSDGDGVNSLQLPNSGVTWTKNIHNESNSALRFNGTSSATTQFSHYPTGGVTFATWIKPTDASINQKVLGIADDNNVNDLISLGIENGMADFEVRSNSGNGRITMRTLADDEWVHIAGTWSTNDDMLRLYVNGNLVGTTTGPSALSFTAPSSSTAYRPTIGAAAWDNSSFRYEGDMDDIRAYNYAMTPWQIKDIVANYNEYCATAIDLPVVGNAPNTNYHAHNFGGNGVNGSSTTCSNYAGGTSWFTVTVPSSGAVTITGTNLPGNSLQNEIIEVYSGTCGNLSYIDCINITNQAVVEVQITGQTPGDVLYVRTWEFANNEFGEYEISAHEPINTTSVEEANNLNAFKIYPNPASQIVTITADLLDDQNVNLSIVNTMGQIVQTTGIDNASTIFHTFNINELAAGTYFVQISTTDGLSKVEKLIVQ